MPFIRGRYHLNPIVGAALEAAREADDALRAQRESERSDTGSDNPSKPGAPPTAEGPIHRVEIEAAEVVPPHSGRAQRGFIARVHRTDAAGLPNGPAGDKFASSKPVISFFGHTSSDDANSGGAASPVRTVISSSKPETHVFSDHHDLVDFLRWELEKDCGS